MIKTLKKIDGSIINIDTRLTLRALKGAQDENLLDKDFLSKILMLSINMQSESEAASKLMKDDKTMYNLVYLSYVNANKNDNMSIDEFFDCVDIDLTELITVYTQALNSIIDNKSTKLAKNFEKVTPNKKTNGKKKKHRH